MNLVWKLLRKHISLPQFIGFFFANLFGMFIVLLGIQFYHDIVPVLSAEDSFMKSDFVIVSKKIGTANTISGRTNSFSNEELQDIESQKFVNKLGVFTSTNYKAEAYMGINGSRLFNSELFFESVPDDFIDVPLDEWKYQEGSHEVPIILPRTYISMYNFGFAQNKQLPKISEGLMGMIDIDIFIRGNGANETLKGRVIGLSNRLNSVLVPQTFMDWSNRRFAANESNAPTRIIMEFANPADENIATYFEENGYEIDNGNLNTEKTMYFLKTMVMLVLIVGLVISALSFYILLLSIYLLVQKNSTKLKNLMLMGYTPQQVGRPYQLLTLILSFLVLLIAWGMLWQVRTYYLDVLETMFTDAKDSTFKPAVLVGLLLFVIVSLLNYCVILRKMLRIWHLKTDNE